MKIKYIFNEFQSKRWSRSGLSF